MPAATRPPNEALRLAALRAHRILDSPPEAEFDDLTREAAAVCGATVARISFVDENREWFKSRVGVKDCEAPREQSFCAHALLTPERPLIVPDATLDARFADNVTVTGGPGYRFYAGFPLRSPDNLPLGTLCVLDAVPRQLSTEQIDRLRAIAQRISVRLSLRRRVPAERRLALGFGAGCLLLVGLAIFFAVQASRFLASDQWVEHTQQVIKRVEHILFEVQAAESSQRGYVASGQEIYLAPYQAAAAALPHHLAALRRATRDNPVQQRNLDRFQQAIDAKFVFMRTRLEQRRTLGDAVRDPRYLDGQGRQLMEQLVDMGHALIKVENTLLRQRVAVRARGLQTAVRVGLGTGFLGTCLLAASFLFTRFKLRRSRELGGALAQANFGLEEEIAERRRTQRRLDLQSAVAQVAAGNVALAEALPAFLRAICEHLDWPVGELWTVDPAANRLRRADHWHSTAGGPAEAAANAAFAEASRPWTFAPGEGLPGRVWSRGVSLWDHHLPDGVQFLRTLSAREAGLQRAFAFPLRGGGDDRITGVLMFLSREPGAPDVELVTALHTVVGQITQFTDRCRAEAGLRASQARFTTFIEHAPTLVYIKDEDGRMLYGNETLLHRFGLRADQWIGKTVDDFWPEAAASIREADRQVLAGKAALDSNETLTEPDGTVSRWLSCKFPLHDEITGRTLLAGMSIDITAREEAEQQRHAREAAERTNQAKSRFLSRVSHELRTPLNAILGFGQLLQLSSLPEQDAEALDYILKAGKHLLTLVDEVLDLSRAEGDELLLDPGHVETGEIVRECVQLVSRLAGERGITCEVRVPAGTPALWADEQRLRQTLLNLLSNAVKYNREGGRVLVESEPAAGDRLRLRVTDTGPGIAPGDLERLFVPFERLEHMDSRVEGVGLGLVLSRRMAEAMGGAVGVESEVGRGSTFWLELPVSQEPRKAGPAPTLPVDECLELSPELRELFGAGLPE